MAHKVRRLSVMLDPGSVLTHGPALFVPFFLAINQGHSGSICLDIGASRVNIPVKIVPIESAGKLSHSVHGLVAQSNIVSLPRFEVVEVLLAVVGFVGVPEGLGDHLEVVHYFRETWRYVIVPVSGAVSNHESFQIDQWAVQRVELTAKVMLIDLP